MLKIAKVIAGFHMEVSPPHSLTSWKSLRPMPFHELMQKADALGVPAQDFYDAAIEADPDVRNT